MRLCLSVEAIEDKKYLILLSLCIECSLMSQNAIYSRTVWYDVIHNVILFQTSYFVLQ